MATKTKRLEEILDQIKGLEFNQQIGYTHKANSKIQELNKQYTHLYTKKYMNEFGANVPHTEYIPIILNNVEKGTSVEYACMYAKEVYELTIKQFNS